MIDFKDFNERRSEEVISFFDAQCRLIFKNSP